MTKAAAMTWDWREQPDMGYLAQILHELSDGAIHLQKVETGSDEYAIVVSTPPLDPAAVDAVYRQSWREVGATFEVDS